MRDTKTVSRSFAAALGGAASAVALCLASGCASQPHAIAPATLPSNAQPPPPPAPAPKQIVLEPPPAPKPIKELPAPPRRVLVMVTERIARAESHRRDSESESILTRALLAAQDLNIQPMRKGTYEAILERDFESLVQRGFEENAEIFMNLFKEGVEFVAICEIGASELSKDIGEGKTLSVRSSVHAGIQMVKAADATVIAAGNGDSEETDLRGAKTRAIEAAARRLVDDLRPWPEVGLATATITVDGLQDFAQADKIAKTFRATEGIIWSRDLIYSDSSPGSSAGVARYEVSWKGTPGELRDKILSLDLGVKLEVTRVEGSRWNLRVAGKPPAPPEAPPQKVPPPPPKGKE